MRESGGLPPRNSSRCTRWCRKWSKWVLFWGSNQTFNQTMDASPERIWSRSAWWWSELRSRCFSSPRRSRRNRCIHSLRYRDYEDEISLPKEYEDAQPTSSHSGMQKTTYPNNMACREVDNFNGMISMSWGENVTRIYMQNKKYPSFWNSIVIVLFTVSGYMNWTSSPLN